MNINYHAFNVPVDVPERLPSNVTLTNIHEVSRRRSRFRAGPASNAQLRTEREYTPSFRYELDRLKDTPELQPGRLSQF